MRAYAQFVHILITNNTDCVYENVYTQNITNFMLCGTLCGQHIEATLFFFYFYYFYFCCFSPRHYTINIINKQENYIYNLIRITENVWLSEKSFLIAGVIIIFFLLLLFSVANECYGSSIIMSVLLISFDKRDFLFI